MGDLEVEEEGEVSAGRRGRAAVATNAVGDLNTVM